MNISLDRKKIQDRCGAVSFKKGDAFYRANKVEFLNEGLESCEAVVTGTEDFHVTLEKDAGGKLHTSCSCPTLASYKKDCQHIAAVLLALHDRGQKGAAQNADGLLTLFNNQPKRTSRHQRHFENREQLDVTFICIPVRIAKDRYLLSIGMKMGPTHVKDIRDVLEAIKCGRPLKITDHFTYDQNLHCFQQETDAVIQSLIQLVHDEKVYVENHLEKLNYNESRQSLLIPPSSWERMKILLTKAPKVHGFRLSKEKLPLQFYLLEAEGKTYELHIKGLDRMVLLDSYKAVLSGANVIQLNDEDYERLIELKQMVDSIGLSYIPIPKDQLNDVLEKVIPGLNKLGDVQISTSITKDFLKIPLVAKLYLDRVKNRLLAGLEFHYENTVINPLEEQEPREGHILVRDTKKEAEILQIMEDSLFTTTESGYFLHNEELEFNFLNDVVPRLQKLVQIYATTAVKNRIFKEKTQARIRVKLKKERMNWLEFKFEMDGILNEDIRGILQALKEKRKYYRLPNGSLFSLSTKEMERLKQFLNALPVQYEDVEKGFEVPVTQGLQLLDVVDETQVFTIEKSFREFLNDIENPDRMAFDVPESLEPILRNYQKQGFKWMKTLAHFGFGGVLADDMGLGKTLQSITFILSELPNIRESGCPALIVCPSSLTYNWLSEIMKFAPDLRVHIIDGSKKERMSVLKDLTEADIIITSYPLLRRDIHSYEEQSFHAVFFDEAQSFKNPVTQTAKAVKKIQAKHRYALTGTPIENSIEELWSIFYVVFPELFRGLKEFSHLSRKKIARRIRPFLLRRTKEDVLEELPEKIESLDVVELLPDQKKLYAAYLAKLKHDTLKHLDKETIDKNRIKILAGLTRLRQICCHPALFVEGYKGSSAKFEQLMQIIEESRLSGRRVLIFSQFTKMLDLIGRKLTEQGLPFFYLDGGTPSEERVERCQRFNEGERDFFLISLKAGGTGLNLTGADTVILYDLWWNPAVEEQAADRAHRIGQTSVVQVIKLVTHGTIEEKMNELQDKKRHLVEEMIDVNEASTSKLTDEDIRELLMI